MFSVGAIPRQSCAHPHCIVHTGTTGEGVVFMSGRLFVLQKRSVLARSCDACMGLNLHFAPVN